MERKNRSHRAVPMLETPRVESIQAQEEERYRLAREIHDGTAQILSNAILELEYCERLLDQNPEDLKAELAHLKRYLRGGLEEVRRFIFDLRPPTLTELGLMATLRSYVQDYQERFHIPVEMQEECGLDRGLSAAIEVAIFRIVQEALQNVRKHAAANQVRLCLIEGEQGLALTIEDDGRGFDPARVESGHFQHMGLTGMRERASLIGGTLEIVSSPGGGTRVSLHVPINS